MDEIRQTVYDTIELDSATVYPFQKSFFSNVQGKSKIKTNMKQNNLLETAVSYRVQGLALDAQNTLIANAGVIPTLLSRSALEFVVGEKTYWTGPARFACGRMYQDGAASQVLLQQYGWAAVQPVILMGRHVIDLNPLQSFSCKWTADDMTAAEIVLATPVATTNVSFVLSLKGLLRRPVQ